MGGLLGDECCSGRESLRRKRVAAPADYCITMYISIEGTVLSLYIVTTLGIYHTANYTYPWRIIELSSYHSHYKIMFPLMTSANAVRCVRPDLAELLDVIHVVLAAWS